MISRRDVLTSAALAGASLAWPVGAEAEPADAIAALERRHGGRLGVAIVDTGSQKQILYRGDELFAMCSTFKCLAAACVLARVDRGQDSLARRVVYQRDVLLPYAPVTQDHVGGAGLSVGDLCAAAVTLSDNTAANLLLDSLGGPPVLTAFLRSIGDPVSRLDRTEPTLNEARPGDPRDTTSPRAMAETLHKLVLGPVLSVSSRDQLTAWLVGCATGAKKLRAGVSRDWKVGDKTGAGGNHATNDVAVLWPPNRAPVVVTAFSVGAGGSDDDRAAILADVGRLAATL